MRRITSKEQLSRILKIIAEESVKKAYADIDQISKANRNNIDRDLSRDRSFAPKLSEAEEEEPEEEEEDEEPTAEEDE